MLSLPIPFLFVLDELCGAIGPRRALVRLKSMIQNTPDNENVQILARTIKGKDDVTAMTDARLLIGITETA